MVCGDDGICHDAMEGHDNGVSMIGWRPDEHSMSHSMSHSGEMCQNAPPI